MPKCVATAAQLAERVPHFQFVPCRALKMASPGKIPPADSGASPPHPGAWKNLLWGGFLLLIFSPAGLGCSQTESRRNAEQPAVTTGPGVEPGFDPAVAVMERETGKPPVFGEDIPRLETAGGLVFKRYKRPPLLESEDRKRRRASESEIPETVHIRDKDLILGGAGFEIKGFEEVSKGKLNTGFIAHLRPTRIPAALERKPDRLDLREENIKSKKNLIFHPALATSFRKEPLIPKTPPAWKPAREEERSVALDEIPATKVLLTEEPERLLKLRPDKESLDLLIGNEKLNRWRYEKR